MTTKIDRRLNYTPTPLDASPIDPGDTRFTLTITGIRSVEAAKEVAEFFEGSEMVWSEEGGGLVAYPSDEKFTATIVRVG
ncbi:MAG: hypothetical protein ABW119_22560 [Candidatus Thiodiazotropha lotti]